MTLQLGGLLAGGLEFYEECAPEGDEHAVRDTALGGGYELIYEEA